VNNRIDQGLPFLSSLDNDVTVGDLRYVMVSIDAFKNYPSSDALTESGYISNRMLCGI